MLYSAKCFGIMLTSLFVWLSSHKCVTYDLNILWLCAEMKCKQQSIFYMSWKYGQKEKRTKKDRNIPKNQQNQKQKRQKRQKRDKMFTFPYPGRSGILCVYWSQQSWFTTYSVHAGLSALHTKSKTQWWAAMKAANLVYHLQASLHAKSKTQCTAPFSCLGSHTRLIKPAVSPSGWHKLWLAG